MIKSVGFRVASLALLAVFVSGAACEEPAVSEMGSSAKAGGVDFELVDYELRLLELEQDGETVEYPDPVLAVEVELTNDGEDAVTYNPSHDSQQVSESSTPLLYTDPGGEAELPPETKELIDGVYLEEGAPDDQVDETTTLEPGDSLTDVFLFEEPDAERESLVLSLPPSMHRGEVPVLFRMNYERREPEGPPVHEVGDKIERDGVAFTIEDTEAKYVEIDDEDDGEAYSSDPLFVVSYQIKNDSGETVTYEPDHRDVAGSRAAALYDGDEQIPRAKLPASASPKDQVAEATDVEAGDAVNDYALFELPPKEADELTFEYPSRRFDRTGLIRVEIPYEYDKPDEPDELAEAEDSDG